MPGYDRTGPMGAGARTGRGLGPCSRPSDESTSVADPNQDYAGARGDWPWGGGRGRRSRGGGWGRGRGGGRGRGRARRGIQDLADFDPTPGHVKTFLMQQVEALTARLDDLKKLLSKDSPAGGEDRGT